MFQCMHANLQVDSAGLDDLQDGNVAAADSSFNQVQGTALANPTTAINAALTAGRPLSALSPGASITAIQNSAVVKSSSPERMLSSHVFYIYLALGLVPWYACPAEGPNAAHPELEPNSRSCGEDCSSSRDRLLSNNFLVRPRGCRSRSRLGCLVSWYVEGC